LSLAHGLSDSVAHGGASVSLTVRVGDPQSAVQLGHVEQKAARGWSRAQLDTTAYAGQTRPLTFEVRTPSDGSRHFCFSAELVP
jgi:hypothetical protein